MRIENRGSSPGRVVGQKLGLCGNGVYANGPPFAVVQAFHNGVKARADRYEPLYTNATLDQPAVSVAEHRSIIRALERGDADAAEHATRVNWRNAAERLRRIMTEAGERGRL